MVQAMPCGRTWNKILDSQGFTGAQRKKHTFPTCASGTSRTHWPMMSPSLPFLSLSPYPLLSRCGHQAPSPPLNPSPFSYLVLHLFSQSLQSPPQRPLLTLIAFIGYIQWYVCLASLKALTIAQPSWIWRIHFDFPKYRTTQRWKLGWVAV